MRSLMTLTNHPGEALLPRDLMIHLNTRVGLQNAVTGMMPLSIVIWWKEETRSNREKMRPFPRESRTSSTRGIRSSLKELIARAFSFLQLTVTRTLPSFFGIATIGLKYGQVECWMRPVSQYWLSTASACLAMMGLMR